MSEELTPDMCVIGAGAGGVSVAAAAAAFGASVVLIEQKPVTFPPAVLQVRTRDGQLAVYELDPDR